MNILMLSSDFPPDLYGGIPVLKDQLELILTCVSEADQLTGQHADFKLLPAAEVSANQGASKRSGSIQENPRQQRKIIWWMKTGHGKSQVGSYKVTIPAIWQRQNIQAAKTEITVIDVLNGINRKVLIYGNNVSAGHLFSFPDFVSRWGKKN
mgnify:CR=1 FL=1